MITEAQIPWDWESLLGVVPPSGIAEPNVSGSRASMATAHRGGPRHAVDILGAQMIQAAM